MLHELGKKAESKSDTCLMRSREDELELIVYYHYVLWNSEVKKRCAKTVVIEKNQSL